MKVKTDAVLVIFWSWAEMVLRWHRLAGRSICERRRQGRYAVRRPMVGSLCSHVYMVLAINRYWCPCRSQSLTVTQSWSLVV